MSQAIIQSIVDEMADAFVGVGLADPGVYTAPGGSPVPCRVFITRSRSPFGDYGTVARDKDSIGLLLSEIPQPQRDAVVAADGGNYRLVRMIAQDDAISTWDVA